MSRDLIIGVWLYAVFVVTPTVAFPANSLDKVFFKLVDAGVVNDSELGKGIELKIQPDKPMPNGVSDPALVKIMKRICDEITPRALPVVQKKLTHQVLASSTSASRLQHLGYSVFSIQEALSSADISSSITSAATNSDRSSSTQQRPPSSAGKTAVSISGHTKATSLRMSISIARRIAPRFGSAI